MRTQAIFLLIALASAPAGEAEPTASKDCPGGMVSIEGKYCIDKYEASLMKMNDNGTEEAWTPFDAPEFTKVRAVSIQSWTPQGYISGRQAAAACKLSGKRLCKETEWRKACKGSAGKLYPYGDTRKDNVCNDLRIKHPVIEYFGTDKGVWDAAHMNNPGINQLADSLKPAGLMSGCTNDYGAFDMVGNLHEWVDDPNGTFLGGFYVEATTNNGGGCNYKTTAHDIDYHDYSTGFRCCADLAQ